MTAIKNCFPVTEYLEDELRERGWTYVDLAMAIGGNVKHNCIALDFLRACIDGNMTSIRLGRFAGEFERVFGVSAGTWERLHEAWCKCVNEIGESA